MQSSLDQENQFILMKQTSENKLFNSIKRIDDKESSWIAWKSFKNSQIKNISLINNILFWRLNTWSYIFINTVEHRHSFNSSFQTNLIMSSHSSTEERSEKFRTHFSQISDADLTKSSSAASFIHEDDESFAETIISLVFYEIWKAQSLALDKETDRLYKLDKQQEDEIKELKIRLQTKENTSSDFIYSEHSRYQKIPDSSLFTDEKNST